MLKVPIEIFAIEEENKEAIESSILILNANQSAFKYGLIEGLDFSLFKSEESVFTEDIYRIIDSELKRVKGYHPHLVGITGRFLYSNSLLNLFGNMQKKENMLLGKAIASTFGVTDLLPNKPIEAYLMFMFMSFGIRFTLRKKMVHKERNFCPFDLKMDKRDIVPVMQYGNFCLPCYNKIRAVLDNNQMNSVRNVLGKISDIIYSDDARSEFEKLLERSSQNEKAQEVETVKLYKEAVSLIKASKTQKAIEILSEYFCNNYPEKYNEIIVHYSRINKLNFENRIGVISESHRNNEYNKINLSIMNLIEFLKE